MALTTAHELGCNWAVSCSPAQSLSSLAVLTDCFAEKTTSCSNYLRQPHTTAGCASNISKPPFRAIQCSNLKQPVEIALARLWTVAFALGGESKTWAVMAYMIDAVKVHAATREDQRIHSSCSCICSARSCSSFATWAKQQLDSSCLHDCCSKATHFSMRLAMSASSAHMTGCNKAVHGSKWTAAQMTAAVNTATRGKEQVRSSCSHDCPTGGCASKDGKLADCKDGHEPHKPSACGRGQPEGCHYCKETNHSAPACSQQITDVSWMP